MLILLFVTTLLLTEIISTEVLICETKSTSISCPQFTNIHINNAIFGRMSRLKCPKKYYDKNVNCKTNNATEVTRKRCEGQQNCTVTANIAVYGDPCYGVYKYLDINYTCVANENRVIVCGYDKLNLVCPRDNILEIKSADFGRHSTTVCPYKDHDQLTNCSLDATKTVAEKCDGQRSCNMDVVSSTFGPDPCYSTYKYVTVNYICKLRPAYENVIICGYDELNLVCPRENILEIKAADFGRHSTTVCPYKDHDQLTNCSLDATKTVAEKCNGQQSCKMEVVSETFGPDPCYSTYKYLTVNYTCVENVKHIIVCGYDELNLVCPQDHILEIKSADFGRHSTTVCPYKDHDQLTNCSLDATKTVAEKCNGQPSCKLEVVSSTFGPDPCYSTYKYVTVNYICKLA